MTMKSLNIGQLLWEQDILTGVLTGRKFEIIEIFNRSVSVKIHLSRMRTGRRVFLQCGKLKSVDTEFLTSPYNNDKENA